MTDPKHNAENGEKEYMPVLRYSDLIRDYPNCPKNVPFDLLDETQAKSNHMQTLKRLAERGGLYPSEMLAVIAKRPFIAGQDIGKCIECINIHLKKHNELKITSPERTFTESETLKMLEALRQRFLDLERNSATPIEHIMAIDLNQFITPLNK